MIQIAYPYVECDHHPGKEPGYIVCRHIKGPDDVAYLELATQDTLGVVSCIECQAKHEDDQFVLNNFIIACAGCLRAAGIQLQTQ
jgi:hypothetical protein